MTREEQLIENWMKTVENMRYATGSRKEIEILDKVIEFVPLFVLDVCSNLNFEFEAIDNPLHTKKVNGVIQRRPVKTSKLRTRVELDKLSDDYISFLASSVAAELNEMCVGREIAFYQLVYYMGTFTDKDGNLTNIGGLVTRYVDTNSLHYL